MESQPVTPTVRQELRRITLIILAGAGLSLMLDSLWPVLAATALCLIFNLRQLMRLSH